MANGDDPSTEMLPGVSAPAATAPRELIGRILGKMTLVERLGRGGSGEVFRAEQAQLGRSAVVKVLRKEVIASPNRVERFLREAKLASRLDHPYAAHVYAFGAEPDGVLWIAMEYVRGVTLDELVVKRGAMPAALFAPLFVRLCEVVHSAHELGIVHRDIKGSNVMVIERAGQLLPKLLDFGIAKADDNNISPGVIDDELTGHGVTLGSPAYMAPEQWTRPHDVDGRADIYALGVLAYRCVCGLLPFQRVERAKLGDAHANQPPPPLPTSVPAALRDVIMRALAKAPGDRWASAVEFGEAIQKASGAVVAEAVPSFDSAVRDRWLRSAPQPIADALAHLTSATTTVEVDAALREVVAITCRWLAVVGLATLGTGGVGLGDARVREYARGVIGRDDGAPWLALARAAVHAADAPPLGIYEAVTHADLLAQLTDRLDDPSRARTAAALATDIAALAEALVPLEPMLAYELVVGRGDGTAESWRGPRRQSRERRVAWDPLAQNEVALQDPSGAVVARLSPLAQVVSPLPSADPELFLLWRGGRGAARLVAAPWGFERDDEAAGTRLAALSTEDSDTSADPGGEQSPYPGLAAYGTGDAEFFVGREREIEALANRSIRAPLIAVLGPSGVGKSSFIHAGVIPRLATSYRVLALRPGRHPLHTLCALPEVSCEPADLVKRLRELGESAQRGLLLVIDQLEEVVTLCSSDDERAQFAAALAGAASDPTAPVRVIATLRDDFATVIEREAALRGRWEIFVLATPPPEALRRIVTEPARRMAVSVEPRVVDDMVLEVAGRPASLPLLSFTASQLWDARDREARKITYGAYVEIGGVQGALATYADQVFESLAKSDRDTVRDLFARLVAADGTRIPARRDELEQIPGARGVVTHLVDARLLVVREEDGHDVIEVVHECLAERWPRLARWRSEDAADRALLGDVRTAARRWSEADRRPDLLWRGQALAELRRLAQRSTIMTATERAFAEASDRAQRTARMWRRWLVAFAMVALATIAAVMIYLRLQADRSRDEATQNAAAASESARLAEQRLTAGLIAQGRRELNDGRANPALAYFGEALKRGADSIALREMIAIASRAWKYERFVGRPGRFTTVAQSPTRVIAGDQDGTLWFFTLDGKPDGKLDTQLGDIMMIKAIGEKLIVAAQKDVAVIEDRKITHTFQPGSPAFLAMPGPGPHEWTAAERDSFVIYDDAGTEKHRIALNPQETGWIPVFSRDGSFALVGGQNMLTKIDLATGTRQPLSKGGIAFPASSADGSMLAYLDNDRDIHLLDPNGRELKQFHGKNDPIGIVFAPTGDAFATYGLRSVIIYDTKTLAIRYQFAIEPDQVVYALRGDEFYTGGLDGVIRHYHQNMLVASLPNPGGQAEAFEVAGDLLAVVAGDSSLVLYDATAAQLKLAPAPCKIPEPTANSFAMVMMCDDGTQHVFMGQRDVADATDLGMGYLAHDPTTGLAALSGDHIRIYAKDTRTPFASSDKGGGAISFIDDHQLAVLGPRASGTLDTWDFRANTWTHLGQIDGATTIAVARGGWVVGTADGKLHWVRDGKVVATKQVSDRVDFLVPSADRKWVVAQQSSGGTIVIDGATGEPTRTFAPADALGAAATIDPTGELVIRPSRGLMTLWERATGDELVYSLDLLKTGVAAQVLADGRIELDGLRVGVLDIARDTRPVAALLSEIACHVPLKVVGSRLEPSATDCH
ncbi:MAG: protein kinase [Kofleriaceae bacterium]